MNLKHFSSILICAALCMAVTGFYFSKAGGSDSIIVNNYPVGEGDTIIATVNLGAFDDVISAYNGVITYDSDIFTVDQVVAEFGNTVYNTDMEDEIRFANMNAIEGMTFAESTEIFKVYLTVKETDETSYNLGYKFKELYTYDAETKTDTLLTEYKNMTSMQLTFIAANDEEESDTSTESEESESETPEESESEIPEVTESATSEENDSNTEEPAEEIPTESPADSVIDDNNVPQDSTPIATKTPSVNVNNDNTSTNTTKTATPKAIVSNNNNTGSGGSSSNNNSGGSSSSSNTGGNSSSSSSGNFTPTSSENDIETPSVVIDDSGSVVSDNSSYSSDSTSSLDDTASTGDKSDLKSTILMGLASLLGCGGIGGLIMSSKKKF